MPCASEASGTSGRSQAVQRNAGCRWQPPLAQRLPLTLPPVVPGGPHGEHRLRARGPLLTCGHSSTGLGRRVASSRQARRGRTAISARMMWEFQDDASMSDNNPAETDPPHPLFSLDLGENGGVFAPISLDELETWVRTERGFWNWLGNADAANYGRAFQSYLEPLAKASQAASEARQLDSRDQVGATDRIDQCRQNIELAFRERRTPHSSTQLAKRVHSMSQQSPTAAAAYLYVMLPNQYGFRFEEVPDIGAWHGFIQGLNERFGITGDGQLRAQREAFADLAAKMERVAGQKTTAYDELERRFIALARDISETSAKQKSHFEHLSTTVDKAYKDALAEHAGQMEALRETFREKMTLRSSVEYWRDRADRHRDRADNLLKATFGSIVGLAVVVVVGTFLVFRTSADPGKPDAWKLAILGFVGVLGVWVARLIVRMFLSDRHLSIDAEERVTMVQTYLALMEDKKVPTDEDRKLILQPLFRPASDGIVKDEGLPHPALELLTRSGSK